MSRSPLVSLGGEGRRFVGGQSLKGGIRDPIFIPSSSISTPDRVQVVRSEICERYGSGGRTGGSTGERGSGACRSFSRVLCPNVRCAKGLGGLASDNRFVKVESLYRENKIQDGDCSNSPCIHPRRGLDVFSGFEGRVPSNSFSSEKQKISPFSHSEGYFSVQGALLRPDHRSTSFHSGYGPGSENSPSVGYSSFTLPRRLVGFSGFGSRMYPGEGYSSPALRGTGNCSELRKVLVNPHSVLCLSGDSDRFPSFVGFTNGEANKFAVINYRRISFLRISASKVMADSFGASCVSNSYCSGGTFENEVAPTGAEETVGLRRSVDSYQVGPSVSVRPSLVDQRENGPRNFLKVIPPQPHVMVRRLRSRVGGVSRVRRRIRSLVLGGEKSLYKFQGTKGGEASSSSLRGFDFQFQSRPFLRQCDSGCLSEESGRHLFGFPQRGGPGNPSLGGGERGLSGSSVHSGEEQCSGGLSLEKESDYRVRMDPQSGGVRLSPEEVASEHRSVRYCHQLQMSDLFCSFERLDECGDGCVPSKLGGPSGLCLSPFQFSQESPQQSEDFSVSRIDPDRSLLASEGVVSGSARGPDGATSSVATKERSSQTAPLSQVPSGAPVTSASCLETVRRFSRHEGFSRKVCDQLAFARRPSTINIYQSKWNVYRKWCRKSGHSVSNPTLPKVADFLLFLFMDKHLSVSAIKGYRFMLSFVFRFKLPSISSSKVLKDLIKSFFLQRPVLKSPFAWDLNRVLSALRAPPFEPLDSITIRHLIQKCLFLIALATAKRVSEIHALSSVVGKQGNDLVLYYMPSFLAKTETADNPLPRSFLLKSLGNFVGNMEEELLVCPVRCLQMYLSRTSYVPSRPRSLFIAPSNNSRPISKNGISFFLRELISKYGSLGASEGPAPRAHSIRAMSTSVALARNVAVPKILEAATWRSNSVFASFYLREVATEVGDSWRLGPFVAAGQVL